MRLIKREGNVFLYEMSNNNIIAYKIFTPWDIFFTFSYKKALKQFNIWVEDLK